MKVSFKLTHAQVELASTKYAAAIAEIGDYEVFGHCAYNEDQSLALIGDVLVYVGQRHPFQQDGALGIMYDIGITMNDTPLEYETSDARLRWYETMDDLVSDPQRISDDDAEAFVSKGWGRDWLLRKRIEKKLEAQPELKAVVAEIYRRSPQWLNAAFDAALIKQARPLAKALHDYM